MENDSVLLHNLIEKVIKIRNQGLPGLAQTKYIDSLTEEQQTIVTRCIDFLEDLKTKLFDTSEIISFDFVHTKNLESMGIKDMEGIADVCLRVETDDDVNEYHIIEWDFTETINYYVDSLKTYGLSTALPLCNDIEDWGTTMVITHVVQPRLDLYHHNEYTVAQLIAWSATSSL